MNITTSPDTPLQTAPSKLIFEIFWWPRMRTFMAQYCKQCTTCQLIETILPSLLFISMFPNLKSTRPWETIRIELNNGVPLLDGFDCIATFVDTFTTQAHLAPRMYHSNTPQFARLFTLNDIYRHDGLCPTIIFDCNPTFTSTFWQALSKLM
jgi:hypothetical protein